MALVNNASSRTDPVLNGQHASGKSNESAPKKARKKGGHFSSLDLRGRGTRTNAQVNSQGYVDVDLHHDNDLTQVLSSALQQREKEIAAIPKSSFDLEKFKNIPRLCIVIQIVGSRGDVQPFVALGKVLMEKPYNHRVRLATHPAFKDFVEENGIEFFSIGGDPEQLMAYMVKNPGLMPGMESLKAGDVGTRRKGVEESLELAWKSCIQPSADSKDPNGGGIVKGETFIADAIIANPPSFAHIHCAEKLHIPLHLMFTMPWSPTTKFPHPLANIKATNVDKPIANYLSYNLMELVTWQGLGDIINTFRVRTLRLEPINVLWAGGLISRLEVPWTYSWSTALIPKPPDWGHHISISGFYFLDLANNYKPPKELQDFLDDGDPPIYIGFGSIVIDDPDKFTQTIFDAVKNAGVRCLLSKGWSKLGGNSPPKDIFLLDNVPHDWLFPRVKAVVHHGGAGTTAIGVALGCPTVVVPFFGDQAFWGAMIARAGAGPEPIGYRDLNTESLTKQIEFALKPETREKAKEMAAQIQDEDGKAEGAKSFHEFLPLAQMRCAIVPERLAVWHINHTQINLSAVGATTLIKAGLIRDEDLVRIHYKEWNLEEGPRGPLSGGLASIVGGLTDIMLGIGHLSSEVAKGTAAEIAHPGIHHRSRHLTKEELNHPTGKDDSSEKSADDKDKEDERDEEDEKGARNGEDEEDHQNGPRMSDPSNEKSEEVSRVNGSTGHGTSDKINAPQQTPRTESDDVKDNHKHKSKNRWQHYHNHQTMHLYSRRNVASAFPGLLYHKGGVSSSIFKQKRTQAKTYRSKERLRQEQSLHGQGEEIGRSALFVTKTIITWPASFTFNVASGFHNAPALFCGDDTVRKHVKIVGIKSGTYAAGREVVLGFWDGFTGVVTQPVRGAKKEGTMGFVKGVGKGLGGLVLKTQAGIWAIPGYTLKGVEKELCNLHGSGTYKMIEHTRRLQGQQEYENTSGEDKTAMIKAWHDLPSDMKKGGTYFRKTWKAMHDRF